MAVSAQLVSAAGEGVEWSAERIVSGIGGLGYVCRFSVGRTLRCAQITPVSHSASMIALYRIASGAMLHARICARTQRSRLSLCSVHLFYQHQLNSLVDA